MSSKEQLQTLSFEERSDTFELKFSSKLESVHSAAAGFERGAMQFPDSVFCRECELRLHDFKYKLAPLLVHAIKIYFLMFVARIFQSTFFMLTHIFSQNFCYFR